VVDGNWSQPPSDIKADIEECCRMLREHRPGPRVVTREEVAFLQRWAGARGKTPPEIVDGKFLGKIVV